MARKSKRKKGPYQIGLSEIVLEEAGKSSIKMGDARQFGKLFCIKLVSNPRFLAACLNLGNRNAKK